MKPNFLMLKLNFGIACTKINGIATAKKKFNDKFIVNFLLTNKLN